MRCLKQWGENSNSFQRELSFLNALLFRNTEVACDWKQEFVIASQHNITSLHWVHAPTLHNIWFGSIYLSISELNEHTRFRSKCLISIQNPVILTKKPVIPIQNSVRPIRNPVIAWNMEGLVLDPSRIHFNILHAAFRSFRKLRLTTDRLTHKCVLPLVSKIYMNI